MPARHPPFPLGHGVVATTWWPSGPTQRVEIDERPFPRSRPHEGTKCPKKTTSRADDSRRQRLEIGVAEREREHGRKDGGPVGRKDEPWKRRRKERETERQNGKYRGTEHRIGCPEVAIKLYSEGHGSPQKGTRRDANVTGFDLMCFGFCTAMATLVFPFGKRAKAVTLLSFKKI